MNSLGAKQHVLGPSPWPLITLGEVAAIERKTIEAKKIRGGEIYVGLENITSEGRFDAPRAVESGELKSSKFSFTSEHLLYGKLRPYLAKIAAPDFSGICSTDVLPIRPGPQLDRRFLLHILRTPKMVSHASQLAVGINLPRLAPKTLEAFTVPLPPIKEQQHIATLLDAADALRAKRRQAIAKLDSLSRALFYEMFGGSPYTPVSPRPVGAIHPEGWAWVPINSLAEPATGHTPDRLRADYWDGDISWINLNEIRRVDGQRCTETVARITPEGVRNSSAVVLPAGTVCFSRTASIGFVTIMGTPMATSQDFVNWICGDQLNPSFLMHALLMSRSTLRATSSGSTHKTIYVRDAARFSVLVPPRDLQDRFVGAIEQLEAPRKTMTQALGASNNLFASLQQRAFRGDL